MLVRWLSVPRLIRSDMGYLRYSVINRVIIIVYLFD
jgi:hypothetical protein